MRHQKGSICLRSGSFYVRAYVNGKQKNFFLAKKDDKHHSPTCRAVKLLRDEAMLRVNAQADAASTIKAEDFWTGTYLPFVEESLRPSSVRSYKQIWKQHLKAHLGQLPLRSYTTPMGSVFLTKLSKKLGRRTLAHIRSLMSGLFAHALNLGLVGHNPIRDVKVLGKVRAPEGTEHYTLEEIENLISALADHADAQLVMALGFFEGLRPSEIAGLQWGDIDQQFIHVRRAVVRSHVGGTKTPESEASVPLIEPVRTMLGLWAAKSAPRKWVFENRDGGPADLHNLVNRVVLPHVRGKGLCDQCKKVPKKPEPKAEWKGLYAARRGGSTALVELTGDLLASQGLLRHKSLTTTALFYKKETPKATLDGMLLLEETAGKKG